jgi:hypothetical protein
VHRAKALAPLERDSEHLARELVSRVGACAAFQVPVNRREVAIEDDPEEFRLTQCPREELGVATRLLHRRIIPEPRRGVRGAPHPS